MTYFLKLFFVFKFWRIYLPAGIPFAQTITTWNGILGFIYITNPLKINKKSREAKSPPTEERCVNTPI